MHVPAGAVPKDGPSAGVTMTTALVSLLTDTPVRAEVGMTGEVTLQGRVLPIGGLKQKVLAAHRAGLTEVILPKRNEGDLDDVPEQVREQMTFHVAESIDQVLAVALRGGGSGSLRGVKLAVFGAAGAHRSPPRGAGHRTRSLGDRVRAYAARAALARRRGAGGDGRCPQRRRGAIPRADVERGLARWPRDGDRATAVPTPRPSRRIAPR